MSKRTQNSVLALLAMLLLAATLMLAPSGAGAEPDYAQSGRKPSYVKCQTFSFGTSCTKTSTYTNNCPSTVSVAGKSATVPRWAWVQSLNALAAYLKRALPVSALSLATVANLQACVRVQNFSCFTSSRLSTAWCMPR